MRSLIFSSEQLDDFKSSIVPAQGAVFDVYQDDGVTPATGLDESCILAVTAEDGTRADYTLDILPDPAIVNEWIGFDASSTDYSIVDAVVVEGYGENPAALEFDGDPATLDHVSVPDDDALTLRENRHGGGPGKGDLVPDMRRHRAQG